MSVTIKIYQLRIYPISSQRRQNRVQKKKWHRFHVTYLAGHTEAYEQPGAVEKKSHNRVASNRKKTLCCKYSFYVQKAIVLDPGKL